MLGGPPGRHGGMFSKAQGCSNRFYRHTLFHSLFHHETTMYYALSWFVIVALWALWSGAAWVLNVVAVWTVSHAGALSSAASGVGASRLPDNLAPWVTPETAQTVSQMLAGLWPLIDGLLQAAPALAAGLTVAIWVVWGIGSALLLLLGVALHALITRLCRRTNAPSRPQSGPPLLTG